MIITCESCATQFQLDSSRIPPEGIRVRCSICKHSFFVENHEAATGDPIERAVGRALAEDQEGVPGVTHDLGRGSDRFEQSFEAARSAVDELLGFGSPAPVEPPRGPTPEPAPEAAPPTEPVGGAPDEIVFDVEEKLAAETRAAAPAALPEADPFAESLDIEPRAPSADPWDTPLPIASEKALDEPPMGGPDVDPWDTPLPGDGPGAPEPERAAAPPVGDPWDTPLPIEAAPPAALVAPEPSIAEDDAPLGERWDAGWESDALEEGEGPQPEPDEAPEAEASAPDLAEAASSLGEEPPGAEEKPEDELEEALKLGWGGSTDTAGIELADEGDAHPAAAMAEGSEGEGWGLDLDPEPDAAIFSPASAAGAGRAFPAIDVGTRLGAPRAQRLVAWLTTLGSGAGWSVVALLAAVLLWASLAPRAANDEVAATVGVAGLEASGIAGHWVENALVGPVLVVSGELRNSGPAPRAPEARLVVRLLDAAGAPLDALPTSAGVPIDRARLREGSAAELRDAREHGAEALARARLRPGERARFEAVILSVPDEASRFDLATEPIRPGSS